MKRFVAILLLAIVALVLVDAAFVVTQWQQVIITRFGEPVRQAITEPGLYFKLPMMEKIHRFDKRFLEWDGKVTEVQTEEKLLILVDTYARWRISDPLVYFQRLQNENRALLRLDGILNGSTRDAVARYDLVELVRSTIEGDAITAAMAAADPDSGPPVIDEDTVPLQPIEHGRPTIRDEILEVAKPQIAQLGIELLDVQFKRINYTEAVRRAVYERMQAERQRIADRFRSEGQGEALSIIGDKERDLKEIQSEAYRLSQEIKGRADAEATEIYAAAYDRSTDTRSFYEFLRTMEAYEDTLDDGTWLMLSTSGDFYRYLQDSGG